MQRCGEKPNENEDYGIMERKCKVEELRRALTTALRELEDEAAKKTMMMKGTEMRRYITTSMIWHTCLLKSAASACNALCQCL